MLRSVQKAKTNEVSESDPKDEKLLREVRLFGRKYHIHTILPLRIEDICVAHWVRLKCKYGCQKYGKSWCCPPETPTSDQTRALLQEYQKALLLCGRVRNGQFYRNNQKKRRIQVNTWKGTLAIERHLFLSGYYKAFSLVSENCALCKKCAYPDECRFPMEKRPSVESSAIDIFQTLKNMGKDFELAKDVVDEYNCYSIILLE